ncbi:MULTISPECIES: nucleoside kinase [Clostridium]|jgi:uridine kinase|uniref:nucleoside kinase n=1 Tax=Clostridium TaxID=1485 RepID=UPI0018A9455D|nr:MULTISPECIES: nucleoside kinase [Clostridium]MBU6134491.1 nucleoside kinase [Clostridium tertium]MDB1932113.1 nucleoside kinase [Clostridium tertium]MDB1935739.1 nucleoside kinase [Clostridium tertium]MDB1971116.1 nucleoside kinase [Clostridium tertium]MDU2461266.1 nucleoside kinase [Clostridium sp.]
MSVFKIKYQGKEYDVQEGITYKEFIDTSLNINSTDVALCRLNRKYHELFKNIDSNGEIELIMFDSPIGYKIYTRTLQFIFIKATLDLFDNSVITIEHSIGEGVFGELHKEEALSAEDIDKIKLRMKELIEKDLPINKIKVKIEKAIEIFKEYGMDDKVSLLNQVSFENVNLYELDGRYDYFYGQMAYSTGVIKAFDLMYYDPGFVLRYPKKDDLNVVSNFKENRKLSQIFMETERWLNILGVGEVGSLNDKVKNKEFRDLVMVSEALHEKKIAQIADMINERKETKVVLIAGPSSSGKTTFANRLSVQLRVNGHVPIPISLDDYFVDREHTPKDENGEYDFESVYSLDLELFNSNLSGLLKGEEVEIPSFNFKKGEREWVGHKLTLPSNGILLIEGIHGLNPILTSSILDKQKFKIYISALTQLNLDNHNRIATTDIRRVRRIVRDYLSRGYGAEETLKMWPSIRRGEERNIFVFQEEADVMFNSTLVYELCVLKRYALEELDKISPDSSVYLEASRLKSFLGFFKEIDKDYVPMNSILREFIGGSVFYKY